MLHTIPVKDLYQVGGILNIEGGYPAIDLVAGINPEHRETRLWANSVLVLDRPLIDHVIFDDLIKNNPYPCLENAIDEINEHQLLASYLMMIAYYQAHGHVLTNIDPAETLHITVHVHQDVGSRPFLDIIIKLSEQFTAHCGIISKYAMDYRLDCPHYQSKQTSHDYTGTHILISLSQCAGLDPNLTAGTMVCPSDFIPFHLEYNTVYPSRTYSANNHLVQILPQMLASCYNEWAVTYINDPEESHYKSHNIGKNLHHQAKVMTSADFHQSKVLQVDRLWNPVDENELVNID